MKSMLEATLDYNSYAFAMQSQPKGNTTMETLYQLGRDILQEANFEEALAFMFEEYEDEDDTNIHLLSQLRKIQELELANAE